MWDAQPRSVMQTGGGGCGRRSCLASRSVFTDVIQMGFGTSHTRCLLQVSAVHTKAICWQLLAVPVKPVCQLQFSIFPCAKACSKHLCTPTRRIEFLLIIEGRGMGWGIFSMLLHEVMIRVKSICYRIRCGPSALRSFLAVSVLRCMQKGNEGQQSGSSRGRAAAQAFWTEKERCDRQIDGDRGKTQKHPCMHRSRKPQPGGIRKGSKKTLSVVTSGRRC